MPASGSKILPFTIETTGTDVYANRDRFKKKPVDSSLLSKTEQKLIKGFEFCLF